MRLDERMEEQAVVGGKTNRRNGWTAERAAVAARDLALPVSWLVAIGCGWRLAGEMDLFGAVIRAAAAEVATLVIWTAGAKALAGALGLAQVRRDIGSPRADAGASAAQRGPGDE